MKRRSYLASFIRLLRYELREHLLLSCILLFLGILAIASGVFLYAEPDEGNPLWRSAVYIASGLDVDPPKTLVGQVDAVVVLFSGVIFVSLLTGYIASVFSSLLVYSYSIGRKPKYRAFENHAIIFGWGDKTKAVLHELNADYGNHPFHLDDYVIIDERPMLDKEDKPIYRHTYHCKGPATDLGTLKSADLMPYRGRGAKVVAILADPAVPEDEADRLSLLKLLAVEQLYPDVISMVEVKQEEAAEHFYNAYADEVLIPKQYSRLLLARTSEFPGVAAYVEELLALAPDETDFSITEKEPPISFYVRSAKALELTGKTLNEAVQDYYQRSSAIIIGSITLGELTLVPDQQWTERPLAQDDEIIVIARPNQV